MAQVTMKEWLDGIQTGLFAQLAENQKALPPGFNKDRFVLNCITLIRDMLRDNKKKNQLQQVDPASIPICLAKGAFLGLDFFNGECYAIPYAGEMKFQTDYKGEIKLCKRFSKNEIKDIFAKVVREGDFYEEEVDGSTQKVVYRPKPFSNAPMIGAFAIVSYKDGSMLYDSMGKDEIESVRENYSKAQNSEAWKNSPGEMYKKTVLRRLCKMIDLEFDSVAQIKAYQTGGDAEFNENAIAGSAQAALPDNGEPTDVFEQVNEREKVPVEKPQDSQSNEEEFRRFEQQINNQSFSDDGSDFIVPESDENLPWN